MILEALECISADLDRRLRAPEESRPRVAVSGLVGSDGTPSFEPDTIALTLVGLDEERNVIQRDSAPAGRSLTRTSDVLYLNLHVMFAATHKRYDTALRALAGVVGFLKSKPVFDARNTPEFPDALRQLSLSLEKLGYSELSHIWSYLGASYLPSAHYTLRMVAIGRPEPRELVPAITNVRVEAGT